MMYSLHDEFTEVYPQQLTFKGEKVEKALAEFKKEVNPPYFTTGYVDGCCPSLKISVSKPDLEAEITIQHPYASVEELYPIAEQSQVGTAKKTLHRLDARKSKEFSSIEVLNESWKDEITTVCGRIGQVLAPGAQKVNAELYKLLIYREGDFFHPHQDAQHSARMFATLLFFLPVKYTGGEFKIYEPGRWWGENVIVEDRKKPDGCSWVAFYTDVRHEVSKVEGGSRAVLNYRLSFDGAMSPSVSLPTMGRSAAITNYFLTSDKMMLAIPLRYEYTQASLSADFLKGIDAYVFSAIEKLASPELCFVLYRDKTKALMYYDDLGYPDDLGHEGIFQGVFLVKHEMAKKYLEIQSESERQLDELYKEENRDAIYQLQKKRDHEYSTLLEEVKASQEGFNLEWIVERIGLVERQRGSPEGNPKGNQGETSLCFEYGQQLGWLGNMTPAEEYYYLRAAIVVRGKKV